MSLRKFAVLDSMKTVEISGEKVQIRRLSFAEVERFQSIPSPLKWGEVIAASVQGCDMTAQEIVDQLASASVDQLAAAIWSHTNGTSDDPK